MAVCVTGALHRDSDRGPVVLDSQICIGCRACAIACPFGMIRYNSEQMALVKCDLCSARLAGGRQPACVEACPTGALELRELDDVIAETQQRAGKALLAGTVAD